MSHRVDGIGIAVFAVVAMIFSSAVRSGAEDRSAPRSEAWNIARGGLLYDKWYAVVGVEPPQETHPSYPATGMKKGSGTWRCKECHGWDYRGKDGAYSMGSHHTGIKGIRDLDGSPLEKIKGILRDSTHGYTEKMIPSDSLNQLALFVSRGQVDVEKYVDRDTKKVKGDAERGAGIFQNVCVSCHGFDGREINFKSEEKPEYVGTVGNKNPQEGLHKIRHGQPDSDMPALFPFAVQDQVDVLAHIQTLPVK